MNRRKMIGLGVAGLIATASSIGILNRLQESSDETRQNAPQVDRVIELEAELFKLTRSLGGQAALEKYVNESQFRESYNSLTNEYNSLAQGNIRDACSIIRRNNFLSGLNGMLFGAGTMAVGIAGIYLTRKRKEDCAGETK